MKTLINNPFQSIYETFEKDQEELKKVNRVQKYDNDFNNVIKEFVINKLSENINSNLDKIEINDKIP
ncbi:hypothetical protein HMPREF3021_06915 [Staphylococcus sp. HMSC070A02]|nr:hypothetical protein HMPREF2798_02410 [Staphylococcus sp. HMSC070A03]OHR57599.1 hypothetical protein HMPREF3021_06915 [Staphylococcus sp. HMSC070A02]